MAAASEIALLIMIIIIFMDITFRIEATSWPVTSRIETTSWLVTSRIETNS